MNEKNAGLLNALKAWVAAKYSDQPYSPVDQHDIEILEAAITALESLPTLPVAGEPEREALALYLWDEGLVRPESQGLLVADAAIAYMSRTRRQPEPRASEHDALIAATEAAMIRNPPNHIVDDPFGATGEAESDPYGYDEEARRHFVAGALFEHRRTA